jgi:hypothetical protein
MITMHIVDLTDGTATDVTIAPGHPPNLCPNPACGGELRLMVRSSYFQYRRIQDDGEVDEDYQNCNDPIGETLETWLECNLCILQPNHRIEERVTGTIEWQGETRPVTTEYAHLAQHAPEAPS